MNELQVVSVKESVVKLSRSLQTEIPIRETLHGLASLISVMFLLTRLLTSCAVALSTT